MQNVSSLYQSIINSKNYYVESALIICENTLQLSSDSSDNFQTLNPLYVHNEEEIWSIKTTRNVFSHNSPEVGCCTCGEIDIQMLYPSDYEIPTMARLTPYVRVVSNDESIAHSEWLRKGVFFIDSRGVTKNDDGIKFLTMHGYDSMLKANDTYPWSSEASPNDIQAVNAIAQKIGVSVDPRTTAIINKNYTVVAPIGYTMIETLSHIAGAYGGNFIINDIGKLQLIRLFDLPVETNYLSTENYEPITFGGDRIDLGED